MYSPATCSNLSCSVPGFYDNIPGGEAAHMAYRERAHAAGFRVHQIVRITRLPEDYEGGWDGIRCEEHDRGYAPNMLAEIWEITPSGDFFLDPEDGVSFPYSCLEAY